MNRFHLIALAAIVLVAGQTTSQAALIAGYNFDGSLSNSAGPAFSPLTQVGTAADIDMNSYHSDGNNSNYLEFAPAVGGANPFTVSVWIYSDVADQGGFKGIFSNNDASTAANSWQFDSHNGVLRMVGIDSGADNFGAAVAGQWQNLVLQKTAGNDGALFLDGVEVVSSIGANPGGLQEFRIGINRNSDNSFLGLIDNVQIFNTLEDAAAIFAAGPGKNAIDIPEPATATLALLGLGGMLVRRNRNRTA